MGTLGIGNIEAVFHWFGMIEAVSDLLNSTVSGSAKRGAPMRRYQAGSSSSPVAVGLSLSHCTIICDDGRVVTFNYGFHNFNVTVAVRDGNVNTIL